ncbi:MAG: pre-peptidase [Planctomycetes bacterium]|nr:pre-peptidase [Planctomycetota bacterium]
MTLRSLILVLMLAAPHVSAAPPKVDYFYPAGAQRGSTVEVTVGGTFERWPVQAWSDNKGIDVTAAKTSGKMTVTVAADTEPGVYFIRLFDEQGASIARPFIVGTLLEMLEKEPNDDPKKPHALDKPGVVVNGRLDKPGDVDVFAVPLKKGETLVASVEAYKTLRSPMDGVLQILSSDGFVLEQNDDYQDFDPQIAFTAPKDGVYLVRLFAFPSVPDASIRFAGKENFVYRLTLTTGPFVEYAYPLAVARQQKKTVELVGWNIPATDRTFNVFSRATADRAKFYHAQIANPFHVWLEANDAIVKSKATRESPQPVTLPITISGRLDRPGDVDVYQFDVKKGQKVAVRIAGRTLGFPIDPTLRVTDSAGKSLSQAKAPAIGSDPTLDVTPTADGAHRVEITDLHARGGMRFVYRLRLGPIAPDFELKVADDRFVLTPSKSLDIPVAITRSGGLNQDITFSVEGLPKEIGVMSSAKGVSLHVMNDKASFNGPIRIVGTAKDGASRMARATVADLGRTTDSLWLTRVQK